MLLEGKKLAFSCHLVVAVKDYGRYFVFNLNIYHDLFSFVVATVYGTCVKSSLSSQFRKKSHFLLWYNNEQKVFLM